MPDVLALRLGGPLQSWGTATRHSTRGTLTHPTKSGVVGLCAAALGRPRGADLSDVAALRFGVRIDQAGSLLTDFHTMSAASHDPVRPREQRVPTADGKRLPPGQSKISHRHYLQDAVFTAALLGESEAERSLLRELEAAFRKPRYPLYLGRRSCPPDRRVLIHRVVDVPSLEESLGYDSIPWGGGDHRRETSRQPLGPPVLVVDDPKGTELLDDLPVPSDPYGRRFAARPVRHVNQASGGHISDDAIDSEDPPPDMSFDGDAALDLLTDEEA